MSEGPSPPPGDTCTDPNEDPRHLDSRSEGLSPPPGDTRTDSNAYSSS